PQTPRWLAAELLEYHQREARPAWWWMYTRCQMSLDELVEDGESISRLEPQGSPRRGKNSLEHRFSFPPQQHKLAPGDPTGEPPRSTGATSSSRGRRAPARRGRARGSPWISSAATGASVSRPRATRRFTTCSTISARRRERKVSGSAGSRNPLAAPKRSTRPT